MTFKLTAFTLALLVMFNAGFFRIAYAQASEFEDAPARWNSTARVSTNGLGSTRLDVTTGAQNVQRGGGWVKADPTEFVTAALPFNTEWPTLLGLIRVANNGVFCVFPDPEDLDVFACFSSPVPGGLNVTPEKAVNVWTWHETDFDVIMTIHIGGISFDYKLFNTDAPTSFDVTISLGGPGVKIQGTAIKKGNTTIISLPPGEATDSSGNGTTIDDVSIPVDFALNGNVLTASIDDTGLTYPIYIDPTVDVDLTQTLDGWRVFTNTFSDSDANPECGKVAAGGRKDMGFRFTGISGLSGVDVTAAALNFSTRSTVFGSMDCAVHFDEIEVSVAATDATTHDAIDLTEASTTFDSYVQVSPDTHMQDAIDVLSSVEEVIETNGHDPSAMTAMIVDVSTPSGDYGRFYGEDRGSAEDPNLLITYDAAGGGATFWFFYLSIMSQVAARWA